MVKLVIGFLVIVLVVAGGVSLAARFAWESTAVREVQIFLAGISPLQSASKPIESADLVGLPTPVRRWLQHAQVLGSKPVRSVRLQQGVTLRLAADQKWLQGTAVQYFRTEAPGFVWQVRLRMNPLLHIAGRDRYVDGRGQMLIDVQWLLPVVDASGPEVDQGTLLRYLAETVWFPTAALSDSIQWQAVDDAAARATMTYGGVTASGIFHFDDAGQVTGFEGQRYKENAGAYTLEHWVITMADHRNLGGLVIPTRADITWRLDSGDFHWFSCEITEIAYRH